MFANSIGSKTCIIPAKNGIGLEEVECCMQLEINVFYRINLSRQRHDLD